MNATGTTRTLRFWWLPVLAALAIGVLTAGEVGAKPIREVFNRSISQRVKDFESACKTSGGTTNVSYGYDDEDNVVSASAECVGGIEDGHVCNYTAEYNDCYQTIRPNENPATRLNQVPAAETTLADDPDVATPPAGQVVVNRAQPVTDLIAEDDEP